MFIVTPKYFSKFFVYLAGWEGEITADDKKRHFVTPLNRQDFLNKTSVTWNIRTLFISDVVALSIVVDDIVQENDLAVSTRSANISDGSNLPTILIHVSRCTLHHVYANNLNLKI